MSTSISQHGAASIRVAAGAPLAGDHGNFRTIDITVLDKDGRPLLEIICFTIDDLRTSIELDLPGNRCSPRVYTISAANPATPDKEEVCAS